MVSAQGSKVDVAQQRPGLLRETAMRTYTSDDFKRWGAQGGAKSKRVLTPAQARAMVAAREKKRQKTKRVVRRANSVLGNNS